MFRKVAFLLPVVGVWGLVHLSNAEVVQGSEILVVARDPADGPGVGTQLEALGATVLVRLEDRIIWAAGDPGIASAVAGPGFLTAANLAAAEVLSRDSDPLVAAVAQEFRRAIGPGRNVGTIVDMRNPLINDAWSQGAVSVQDYLANLRAVGLDPADATVSRQLARPGADGALRGNSDNMTGTVAIELLFVESNGALDPNLYTWTVSDENTVIAGTTSALAWWAAEATARGQTVSFAVYDARHSDTRVQQAYEPILRPSTDAPLWVGAVMANFGFSVGDHLARSAAFTTASRIAHGTSNAYTVFVCYNPVPAPDQYTDGYSAWAYLGGPYTNLLWRSFGWPFDQVFTHETGHIFWACDEYYQAGYGGCTSCGLCSHGTNNGNCEFCNPSSVSCMMRDSSWGLCTFTPGHLGWGTAANCGDGQCDPAQGEDCHNCPEDCPRGPNGECIPAVSEWGLLVMTLLICTVGTIAMRRSQAVLRRAGR